MKEDKNKELKEYLLVKIKELQASMNKSKRGLYNYLIDKAKRDMCKEVLERL